MYKKRGTATREEKRALLRYGQAGMASDTDVGREKDAGIFHDHQTEVCFFYVITRVCETMVISSIMHLYVLISAAALFGRATFWTVPRSASASPVSSWSNDTQDMFSQGMTFLDSFYDRRAGYLYDLSSATGLRHESRQTVFYALGLLARNQGQDAGEAARILYNIVAGQITDPESGAYVKTPLLVPRVGIGANANAQIRRLSNLSGAAQLWPCVSG